MVSQTETVTLPAQDWESLRLLIEDAFMASDILSNLKNGRTQPSYLWAYVSPNLYEKAQAAAKILRNTEVSGTLGRDALIWRLDLDNHSLCYTLASVEQQEAVALDCLLDIGVTCDGFGKGHEACWLCRDCYRHPSYFLTRERKLVDIHCPNNSH